MTLLYQDGFDHMVDAEDIQEYYPTATVAAMSTVTSTAFGRGRALRCGTNGTSNPRALAVIPPQAQGVVMGAGIRFRVNSIPATYGGKILLGFFTGTTNHVRVDLVEGGIIRLRTANFVYRGDMVNPIVTGQWYHLEVKCKVDDTTGFVEVRLDGRTVLYATGDTRDASTGIVDNVATAFNTNTSNINGDVDFDDFSVWNEAGTINNDWLGDCEVQTSFATADDVITGWTANVGSAWDAINDAGEDGDTTFISSSTVNAPASFVMGDLATTPSKILGVQVTALALKTDSGNRSVRVGIDSNAAVSEGADTALGLTYAPVYTVVERNPDGNVAWTPAAVNAAKARVRITV